ncbi:MAG: Crp/Fnr family transcriptional regulator [Dehalococcoidia bacterium]|nr:Crp/Fnr family transcriptional regulator [Dehalococcoidia bacterium]
MSLIDGEPRSASAVSMGATEVIVLYRDDFLSYLMQHPRAAITGMTVLCARLRRTDDLVADAVFLDTRTRLAKKLVELSETFGEAVDGGVQITLRLRQQDLANMVGANRESVNRYLSAMENQGLIRTERQRITLLNPLELRRRSF